MISVPEVLTAMLSLMPGPSPAWNETQEQYLARAQVVAESVVAASDGKRQRAMAILVVFWGESRFSPLIHAGLKLGDGGKAICLGQHHQLTRTTEEWASLAGTDREATTRCARATGDALVRSWHYCRALSEKFDYTEAFTLYGTGSTCRPTESKWKNIFIDRGEKWHALVTHGRIS